jgi:hypothetical protein
MDEPLTWTSWLNKKGYPRNTAGRYIDIYECNSLEDLAGKSMADLLGSRQEKYEIDPPAVGEASSSTSIPTSPRSALPAPALR